MNKFTYKIVIRKDRKLSTGTYPLCLLMIYTRKNRRLSLNIDVELKNWDSKAQLIRKGDPEYTRKNKLITVYKNRIAEYEMECIIKNKPIILDNAIQCITHKTNKHSFYEYIAKEWPNYKASLKPNTLKKYQSQLNVIQKFRNNLLFSEIDVTFLKGYETFLTTKRSNNKNTISKSLKWIKTIINQAIKDGTITTSPFTNYKISTEPGYREYLSLKELTKLEKIYLSKYLSINMQETLRAFLFCCYTGLRLSDMKTLQHSFINDGILTIVMHKTEVPVFIPLNTQAKSFITSNGQDYIFNTVSDLMLNKHLKKIMKQAKISKKITFHSARHTFATNSLNLGIPKDVVQRMLGHRDIKTTDIYTKYTVNYLKKEMKKWKNEYH